MRYLATIGSEHEEVTYIDRPTVKVLIQKHDKILLLNQKLLPGGGVDAGESDNQAVTRELQEELGFTVDSIRPIGTVIQYRTYLQRKYVINGYVANLVSEGAETRPQDEGETAFTQTWCTLEEAKKLVENAISSHKQGPADTDAYQGKLYNLQTTLEFLKALESKHSSK